ncbi:MAG: hypothetical protein WAN75_39270 [Xanthobacteraceae bacterium]
MSSFTPASSGWKASCRSAATLQLRALTALDQVEEPAGAGGEARSGGGLARVSGSKRESLGEWIGAIIALAAALLMAAVFVSWLFGVMGSLVSLAPWFAVPIAVLVLVIMIHEAR